MRFYFWVEALGKPASFFGAIFVMIDGVRGG
jgi:hypothetical protein